MIEYVPAARFGASVATPLASKEDEPKIVVPILKVTVPVGVGPLMPVTVAT
jgi:hypothetical protein